MEVIPEINLIERIQAGEYSLFERIVDDYQNRLFAFVYRIVNDHDDALDICQDTFFKAYKKINTFKTGFTFSTWLFQIGYNNSMNYLKKRNREKAKVDILLENEILNYQDENKSDKTIDLEQLNQLLDRVLADLRDSYRIALHLFYNEHKDYNEIAEIMDIPINSVKSNIHRGRETIKRILSSEFNIMRIESITA